MKKQSFKYYDDPRKIVTDRFSGETLNYLWEYPINCSICLFIINIYIII